MKKGFTLIELLSVIIILGILALITTPIVLDTITDSKKNSMRISVENYLDAIENEIARVNVNGEYETLDGIYTISDGGKTIIRDSNTILYIDYNGKGLESGQLIVENGLIKQIISGVIDKWYAKIESKKVVLLDEITGHTLVIGQKFNAAIKTLANAKNVAYTGSDSKITKIIFLTAGTLPEGYTYESFSSLTKAVDVSEKQDGTILAVYDNNGTIYVYSEDNILSNSNSSYMFSNCSSLTSLDFSNFDTTNVTDMSHMFDGCSSLTSLDVSNFDTSNVTTMSGMFTGCTNLTCIQVGDKWTTENADISNMFSYAGVSEVTTNKCTVSSS